MYAKLFRQIYESSIAEDYETRHVFMDMVVLADPDGVVDMTPEAISRITNVPLDKVRAAITKLESPDARSRTPDYEGCRLVRLDDHRDWGWVIVNYARFRGTATEEKRRELTRLRVKRLREKRSGKQADDGEPCNAGNALPSVTSPSPSPSPSALQSRSVELPDGFPISADDAVTQAAFVGCDPIFATGIWNKAMGRGGCDSRDIPIRSFRHHLATEWAYEQNRRAKPNGHTGKVFPRDIKLQMDAVKLQIDQHPANPESTFRSQKPTDLERNSFRELRKKWANLNALLANGGSNA